MRMGPFTTLLATTVGGILFFGLQIGAAMAAVAANARWSPDFVWFPLPIAAMLILSTTWAERRLRIGLTPGAGTVASPRILLLTLVVAVVGVAACVVQGAWYDMVRDEELGPAGVGAGFQFAYAVTLSMTSAVLAEVTFRGILQTRFEEQLGRWPAIIVVTAINVVAHRWGPELVAQWLGIFVALGALGWLRSVTRSLWPALLAHAAVNFLLALAMARWHAFDQGLIGDMALALMAAAVVLGWALALWIGGSLPGRKSHADL